MSYDDILEARKKRNVNFAENLDREVCNTKRKLKHPHPRPKKQARKDELVLAEQEVVASGLAGFSTVFQLWVRERGCCIAW